MTGTEPVRQQDRKRLSDGVNRAPAKHIFCGRIEEGDPRSLVHGNDGIFDRLDRVKVPVIGFAKFLIHPFFAKEFLG